MSCFRGNKEEFYGEVLLLDGTKLSLSSDSGVKRLSRAGLLLQQVCSHLRLTQTQFFGLRFYDNSQQTLWLDPDKTFSQHQALSEPPYIFYFGVRFYSEEPHKLEEMTRLQFYLQLQEDVVKGKMPLPQRIKPRLQALLLQAEKGDYSEVKWAGSEDNQEVTTIYRALSGVSQTEAQTLFLSLCCSLPLYGVTLFHVYGENQTEYSLGPTPVGVAIYKNRALVGRYFWQRISKIYFKKQTFELRVINKNGSETSFLFHCASRSDCKRLWSCCVQHHGFYRLHSGVLCQRIKPGSSFKALVLPRFSLINQRAAQDHISSEPANQTAAPGHSSSEPAHQTAVSGHSSSEPAHQRAATGHAPSEPANETAAPGHSSSEPAHQRAATGYGSSQPANQRAPLRSGHAHHDITADSALVLVQTASPAVSRSLGGASSQCGPTAESSSPWENSSHSGGLFNPRFPLSAIKQQGPHRRSRSLDGERPIREQHRRARSHGNSSSESEKSTVQRRHRRKHRSGSHGDQNPDSAHHTSRNKLISPDATIWRHIQRELVEPEAALERSTEQIPFTQVRVRQQPERRRRSGRGQRHRMWASVSELEGGLELIPPLPVTTATDTSCGQHTAP